jgi:hypothetical protein
VAAQYTFTHKQHTEYREQNIHNNQNWETIRLLLTRELEMRKICAKMVLRDLTEQQRDAWLSTVFDNQMHYSDDTASLLT